MAVLNPFKQTDHTIMQDTDLAGPLVFCLAFGGSLMLVCTARMTELSPLSVLLDVLKIDFKDDRVVSLDNIVTYLN